MGRVRERGEGGRVQPIGPPEGAPSPPLSAPPDPADFAGAYSFYHDGWRGWLILSHDEDRRLTGTYQGEPPRGRYAVTAEVDADVPHRVAISIHDFNWMDRQVFDGFLLRAGKKALAGRSLWAGNQTHYGFLARKTASLALSEFPGERERVRPADFAGRYSVCDDGRPGLLSLAVESGCSLRGMYEERGLARPLAVQALVDETISHAIEIAVDDPETALTRIFHGYLFARGKNAIAGWVEAGDCPAGFYMTKLSGLSGTQP